MSGHKQDVLDIAWCPFNDNIIASGSEDTTVKVWKIPEDGLVENLNKPLCSLEHHQRRVHAVVWNPVANNILMSASHDNLVLVWNLETQEIITEIDCHPDIPHCISWNYNGSMIASTCKDKQIRVIDARTGEVKQVLSNCFSCLLFVKKFILRTNCLLPLVRTMLNARLCYLKDLSEYYFLLY